MDGGSLQERTICLKLMPAFFVNASPDEIVPAARRELHVALIDVMVSTALGLYASIRLSASEHRGCRTNHLRLPEMKNRGLGVDPTGAAAVERLINGFF